MFLTFFNFLSAKSVLNVFFKKLVAKQIYMNISIFDTSFQLNGDISFKISSVSSLNANKNHL